MNRYLGWIAIAWMLGLCTIALVAYGRSSGHVSLEARTASLAGELRCLVCRGESVADSSSDFARSVRASIRRQLQAGKSPDQIKAYFASRYGDSVLLSPRASGVGRFAWLAPPLLSIGGLGLLVTLVLGWRMSGKQRIAGEQNEYLERVRAELSARTPADG